jgi:[histone H3]-lysine4 N-trimethyltransferase ATXR3
LDNFKIHPKGTGVICIRPEGIPSQVLVTDYLGEIYPAYRWCEKLDVVEQAQARFALKPTLPDFYNILLERPRQDPDGYGE